MATLTVKYARKQVKDARKQVKDARKQVKDARKLLTGIAARLQDTEGAARGALDGDGPVCPLSSQVPQRVQLH